MKRTCGPKSKTFTSLFSKFVSASEADTAKMSASMPRSSAAFRIFVTNKLVLIPAEQTNIIVFFAIFLHLLNSLCFALHLYISKKRAKF